MVSLDNFPWNSATDVAIPKSSTNGIWSLHELFMSATFAWMAGVFTWVLWWDLPRTWVRRPHYLEMIAEHSLSNGFARSQRGFGGHNWGVGRPVRFSNLRIWLLSAFANFGVINGMVIMNVRILWCCTLIDVLESCLKIWTLPRAKGYQNCTAFTVGTFGYGFK